MDRNSIIGLLLIGAIMVAFTIVNKPDREELEKAQLEQVIQDSIATAKKNEAKSKRLEVLESDTINLENDSIAMIALTSQFGSFGPAVLGVDSLITLKTDKHILTINSKGAQISQVQLLDYKTWTGEPLKMFYSDSSQFAFELPVDGKQIKSSDLNFNEVITENKGDSTHYILRSSIDESHYIDIIYTSYKDSYKLRYQVDVTNIRSLLSPKIKELDFTWSVLGSRQEKNLSNERNNTTAYYRISEDESVDKISPLEAGEYATETKTDWIGFKEQFFAAVIISPNGISPQANLKTTQSESSDSTTKGMLSTFSVPVDGNSSTLVSFDLYYGPTHYATLKEVGYDLQKLIPLGWGIFGWVNKFIVIPAFNFLGQFNLGYGLVILLLTLYIKTILLAFQYKSYISQAKMRVLKPEIDELNKKYEGGDAMQKQQAVMALYRDAGVNPLGGCLPMLFQIPVLFAMFNFFPASIELRQESFLWAEDLSTYDSIMNLPFEIPFYGNHISLFALLMTISTIIYTRMNNQLSAGNTQMMPGLKWMMYLMPIIFLFVLNSYASGLNYYYFLANIITFAQQFAFRKLVNDEKIHAKIQQKKNNPKAANKSSFQQRLEDMAKARTNQAKKS